MLRKLFLLLFVAAFAGGICFVALRLARDPGPEENVAPETQPLSSPGESAGLEPASGAQGESRGKDALREYLTRWLFVGQPRAAPPGEIRQVMDSSHFRPSAWTRTCLEVLLEDIGRAKPALRNVAAGAEVLREDTNPSASNVALAVEYHGRKSADRYHVELQSVVGRWLESRPGSSAVLEGILLDSSRDQLGSLLRRWLTSGLGAHKEAVRRALATWLSDSSPENAARIELCAAAIVLFRDPPDAVGDFVKACSRVGGWPAGGTDRDHTPAGLYLLPEALRVALRGSMGVESNTVTEDLAARFLDALRGAAGEIPMDSEGAGTFFATTLPLLGKGSEEAIAGLSRLSRLHERSDVRNNALVNLGTVAPLDRVLEETELDIEVLPSDQGALVAQASLVSALYSALDPDDEADVAAILPLYDTILLNWTSRDDPAYDLYREMVLGFLISKPIEEMEPVLRSLVESDPNPRIAARARDALARARGQH